ncbi:MAG: polysaccharide pyruvyl transferase family protein [Lachnospiraceae bacterium]|nr:polysaccharide pyruvyl transferase family protein [Lachnospiraceae bacterium]
MRIAIISKYYKNYNYGGLLQAYALTRILHDMGHDVQQISFLPNEKKKYGIRGYIKIFLRSLGREIVIRLKAKKLIGLNHQMHKFMKEIPHTRKVTEKTISLLNRDYDCFIAGSDQIWNPGFSYDAYFLGFAEKEKIKISYAASMGITMLKPEQKKYFKEKLNYLDAISVREYEAKILLEKEGIDKQIDWVLDPTMLLSSDKWVEMDCYEQMDLPDKYILVYSMAFDLKKEELIANISKKMKLPIVRIPFTVADYSTDDKLCTAAGPKEFVTLIRHAEIVLTDSFHATSFSIINHKIFFCMQRDEKQSMNSRLDSLFRLFEIPPRWVSCMEDVEKVGISIPYKKVDKIMNEYRSISIRFLQVSIEQKGE